MPVRIRLSMLMFLQYAIMGAWHPVLSQHMIHHLHFTGQQAGMIYGFIPLATIVANFFIGYLADHHVEAKRLIALFHGAGAILLFILVRTESFFAFAILMFAYCLCFAPTVSLANSITLSQMHKQERRFGGVRVWGTIGWIISGLILTGMRYAQSQAWLPNLGVDSLLLAGIMSVAMMILAFYLPRTEPSKDLDWHHYKRSLKSLYSHKSLRNLNLITFLFATQGMFYYIYTGPYLTSAQIGLSETWLSTVMASGQITELFVMGFLLAYGLHHWGVKKTMLIGLSGWALRYWIFALGAPKALVIAALPIHGLCYTFVLPAATIFIAQTAPPKLRHSAQALFTFITTGLGNFIGSLLAGWIYRLHSNGEPQWSAIFIWPGIFITLCAILLAVTFKPEEEKIG